MQKGCNAEGIQCKRELARRRKSSSSSQELCRWRFYASICDQGQLPFPCVTACVCVCVYGDVCVCVCVRVHCFKCVEKSSKNCISLTRSD